jgi:hypothetical protein
MADGEQLGQRIAALMARVEESVAKARDPRDGDGDGKINDGKPNEGPALGAVEKPGGHGSEGKAMASVGFVGSKTNPAKVMPGEPHPTVLKDIGQEAADAVWAKIADKAPAAELMAALEPAAEKMRLITPTVTPDMTNEQMQAFVGGRTYAGGKDIDETLDDLVATAKGYAKGKLAYDRKMTVVVGPPAAGKSTVSELLAEQQGAAIWDSDDAKKLVPEFAGGLGAAAVHEESKFISDAVGMELRASGANIIYPVVGHNREKLAGLIDDYQSEGYTVELLHVMVTPDEAARRMAARYLKTGRLIDPGYFASIGDKPKTTYQTIKGEADGYAEIDVNGPQGSERITESIGVKNLVAGRALRPGGGGTDGGPGQMDAGGAGVAPQTTAGGSQGIGGNPDAKVFFEVAPDPNDAGLTARWNALDDADKFEISQSVSADLVPKALEAVGSKGEFSEQIGGYLGATNPSLSVRVDDPAKAIELSKVLGFALSQDSMMVVSETAAEGMEPVGIVTIELPESERDLASVSTLYDRLWAIKGEDGEPLIGGHSTADGQMIVLNYSGVPTDKLADLIDAQLERKYDISTDEAYSAFPDKKEYDYASGATEGAAPLRQAAGRLRSEATTLVGKYLARAEGRKARRPQGVGITKAKPGTLRAEMDAFAMALSMASEPVEPAVEPSAIERVRKGIKGLWQSWMHPRAPKGHPDGGKFQPKPGSDAAPKPKVTWSSGPLFDTPKPKAKHPLDFNGITKPFDGPKTGPKWTGKTDTGADKSYSLPSSAVKHPHTDDDGGEVWVKYPSKASPEVVWNDPDATATFTPNSPAPAVLQGIPTKLAYKPPQTAAEWVKVPGQNPAVEAMLPELTAPKGKNIGAGVIVQEEDGRVWIVSPTNGFGGYRQTFPKGTYEDDVPSLQANAIKEAFEESGLQVEITGVLGDFERTTSTARMYLAKRVGGSPARMGWESQAVRLAPVSTLRTWLNNGYTDHPIVEALEDLTGVKVRKKFDESKVDRWPKGTPLGGQFKDQGGGSGGYPAPPKIGWKKDGSGPGANATYYNQMKAVFDAAVKGDIAPAAALYKKNFAIMDAFNPNVKTNSHTKWKAQVGQYAMELMFVWQGKGMAAQSAKVIDGKLGPQSISGWTLIKSDGIGGTAPKGLYEDADGQKWLVKGNLQGKDDARARNEVLASKLMEAAGIPAPEYKLVDLGGKYGGGLGVATKWVEGLQKISTPGQRSKAKQQFAVHAWLGNWDVVGMGGDNLLVTPDGEVVNIDPGGALLYRAQGQPKTAMEFTAGAPDWETMRDPAKNADAAGLFGSMNATGLQDSAEALKGMTDEKITALVDAYWVDDGQNTKQKLASKLMARRDQILAKANLAPMNLPAASDAPQAASSTMYDVAAKTGAFVAEPPVVSPGGKAAESIATIQADEQAMGKATLAAKPMLSMLNNTWLTNAMNTDGKTKWDAMKVAAYYGQLAAFHDGISPASIAQIPDAIAKYLYTASEFEEANNKFGTGKPGVTTMAAGVSLASTPSAASSGYPEITDMKSAQEYAELAVMDAQDGLMPTAPKGPGMHGNTEDVNWLKKKYIEGFPPSKSTHELILNDNLYDKASTQGVALGGYGKALATYHDVLAGVTPKWGEKTASGAPSVVFDMISAEYYAKQAVRLGSNGIQPLPPTLPGDAYSEGISWLQSKYGPGGPGAVASTHAKALAGTLYGTELDAGMPNTTAINAYAKAMATNWEIATGKKAKGAVDTDALYAELTADTVKPALPDFAAAKLDASNSNASSHNAKVDLIEKLANVGNKSGILGLNYGTNTYGKKQAALANNALAALGSPHKVVPGQKKLAHPALTGAAENAAAADEIEEVVEVVEPTPAKPKKVVITKADLPPKPTFDKSSKAWKNTVNQQSVDAIEAAALEGNLTKLKGLTYPEHIDDAEGTLTGKQLEFSAHPSMKMQGYWSDTMKAVDDKFNPPKPLVPAKTIKKASLAKIAEAFPTAPLLTTVKQMPMNQRVGFWMALGQVQGERADFLPKAPITETVPASFKNSIPGLREKASPLSKQFMNSVQGSGAINDAYNQGKTTHGSIDLVAANVAMHKDAVELPEGSTVYKWLRVEPNMQAALLSAPVGTVLQNPGSACNSMSPTSTSGFAGSDPKTRARIVYRAAKGAKMMPTYKGSGYSYDSEAELTSLPGARMVLLGTKKMGNHFEIEVTLLPPHKNSLLTKL